MLLPFWQTTITRIRPGIKFERGSAVPDWENVSRLDINECLVQPVSTSLTQDGRIQGITDGLMACAPLDADIKAGDRVEYLGDVYTINGDVMKWVGVGRLEHVQFNLVRWRG